MTERRIEMPLFAQHLRDCEIRNGFSHILWNRRYYTFSDMTDRISRWTRQLSTGAALLWVSSRPAEAALSLAQVFDVHQRALNETAAEVAADSLSGRSERYYYVSMYLMGMLSAAESTNNESELRLALHYIDNMVASSRTQVNRNGIPRKAWKGNEEIYVYQGAEPIARCAAVIMKNPAWAAKYAERAQAYADFVDDLIIQGWYVDVYNRRPTWLAGDPESWGDGRKFNDKAWLLADIVNSLHLANPKPVYLAILDEIATGFRKALQPHGTGWAWNRGTIPVGSDTNNEAGSVGNQAGSPDTAHANRAPVMMIFQYEAGRGSWTQKDLERLGNTLGDTLWNQSASDPIIANYVTGENEPYRTRKTPGSNGFIFSGWALAARYAPKAKAATMAVLQAIENGSDNDTVKANRSEYYKKVALTGHLMRAMEMNGRLPRDGQRDYGTPEIRSLRLQSVMPSNAVVRPETRHATRLHWRVTRQTSKAETPAEREAASLMPVGKTVEFEGHELAFEALHMTMGEYRLQVEASNEAGELSAPALAEVSVVRSNFDERRIYPNPWRSDQHTTLPVTFDRLPANTTIKIFTVAGNSVRTMSPSGDTATWDLRNASGDKVGSGIYLYSIRDAQDQQIRGKLVVIK